MQCVINIYIFTVKMEIEGEKTNKQYNIIKKTKKQNKIFFLFQMLQVRLYSFVRVYLDHIYVYA